MKLVIGPGTTNVELAPGVDALQLHGEITAALESGEPLKVDLGADTSGTLILNASLIPYILIVP
jgi:hypothetical protein